MASGALAENVETDDEEYSPMSDTREGFGELEEVPGEMDEARQGSFLSEDDPSAKDGGDLSLAHRDAPSQQLAEDEVDSEGYDDTASSVGEDEDDYGLSESAGGESPGRKMRNLTVELEPSDFLDRASFEDNDASAVASASVQSKDSASKSRAWTAASLFRKLPSTPLSGRRKAAENRGARASSLEGDGGEGKARRTWSPASASLKIPRTPLSALRRRSSANKTPKSATTEPRSLRNRTFSTGSLHSLLSSPLSAMRKSTGRQTPTPRSDASSSLAGSPRRRRRFWSNASSETEQETGSYAEEKRGSAESKLQRFRAAFRSGTGRVARFGRRGSRGSAASDTSSQQEDHGEAKIRHDFDSVPPSPRSPFESGAGGRAGSIDDDDGDARAVSGDERSASESEASSQRTTEVSYEEEVRVCLLAFYIENNPEKVGDVPLLLEKYAGQEEQMLLKLEDKYDAEVLDYEDALEVIRDFESRQRVGEEVVSPPLPRRPTSPPLPPRPTSPQSGVMAAPEKTSFAEPFGTVAKVWITATPKPMLGLSYFEHERAIILRLDPDFLRAETPETVLEALFRAHDYYLHGGDDALADGISELKQVLGTRGTTRAPEDDGAESPQPQHGDEDGQGLGHAPTSAIEVSSDRSAEDNNEDDEDDEDEDDGEDGDEESEAGKRAPLTRVQALVQEKEKALETEAEAAARDAPDWMWEGRAFEAEDDKDDARSDATDSNDERDEHQENALEDEEESFDREDLGAAEDAVSEGSWDRETDTHDGRSPRPDPELSSMSPSTGEETTDFEAEDGDAAESLDEPPIANSRRAPLVPTRSGTDGRNEEDEDAAVDDGEDGERITYRDRVEAESRREWKKRLRLLDSALFEVVDTERQYFNDLDTINDLVIGPMLELLQKRKLRFTQKGASTLVSFLRLWPRLTRFHQNLNERLWRRCVDEQAGQNGVPLRVSWEEQDQALYACLEELASLQEVCHTYDDYCMQYAAAVACYAKELQVNKQLGTYLRQNCEGALRGGSLENFLIKPVQRICRYPLLLQAVAEHQAHFTPMQRRAADEVNRAIRDIASWIEHIDAHKSQAERLEAMTRITQRLRFGEDEAGISLTEPHRVLLRADTLQVVRDGQAADAGAETRFVILYNDVILLTVARKSWLNPSIKVYDVMQVLPLRDAVRVPGEHARSSRLEGPVLRLESDAWRLTQTLDLGVSDAGIVQAWSDGLDSALEFANNEVNEHRDASLLAQLAQRINSKRRQSTFIRQLLEKPAMLTRTFGRMHETSAVVIQKTYRGLLGRRHALERQSQIAREVRAALTIQRAFKRMKKNMYWSKQRKLESDRKARPSYEALRQQVEEESATDDGDDDDDDDDDDDEQRDGNVVAQASAEDEGEEPYSDWDDSEMDVAPLPRTTATDGDADSLVDFDDFDEAVGVSFRRAAPGGGRYADERV